MPRTRFLGTGFAVPDRVVTNDDLSQMMDTSDEWIRTRTGIRERRWVREGETGVDLALAATHRALEMAGPIGLSTSTRSSTPRPRRTTSPPETESSSSGRSASGTIPAIDIRTQCSGFIYALSVADGWVRTGQYRRVLVVGAEVQSTGMLMTTEGRNVSVIFADGAGAAVVGPTDREDQGILAFDLHSEGAHAEKLWVDSPGSMYHPRVSPEHIDAGRQYLDMDGKEVFRHAVVRMPESVQAVLAASGRTIADLKLLVAHQANLRIAEMMQRTLCLRDDQIYNNIMTYGNTTAATIPIALDECVRAGRMQEGDLVVLTAFGSGFLWGSAAVVW